MIAMSIGNLLLIAAVAVAANVAYDKFM